MSVSSQRRIRLSAWSSVRVPYSSEYSLIIAVLVSLTFPISAEYCSYAGQNFAASPSVSVKFAAMSCFLIERISRRSSSNCRSVIASEVLSALAGCEDLFWANAIGLLVTHSPTNRSAANVILFKVSLSLDRIGELNDATWRKLVGASGQ